MDYSGKRFVASVRKAHTDSPHLARINSAWDGLGFRYPQRQRVTVLELTFSSVAILSAVADRLVR